MRPPHGPLCSGALVALAAASSSSSCCAAGPHARSKAAIIIHGGAPAKPRAIIPCTAPNRRWENTNTHTTPQEKKKEKETSRRVRAADRRASRIGGRRPRPGARARRINSQRDRAEGVAAGRGAVRAHPRAFIRTTTNSEHATKKGAMILFSSTVPGRAGAARRDATVPCSYRRTASYRNDCRVARKRFAGAGGRVM